MKKYQFGIILVLVALINILQSTSTELLQDEAYYWMYSNFLDWGYFDHPPLVAVYIYLSDFFFSDELGVRFMSAIFYSITAYLVWTLIDIPDKKKHQNLFLLAFISTALLNVYGFITVPDTPFLFFMALYLIAYKRILKSDDWQGFLLFAVSIAGLLYSKYTGVLVIAFTIFSNLSLLANKKFWLSAIGVVLLFLPHLLWQYFNDYPSIRYHLFERSSNRTYRIDYTMMHLLNQIAIIGFTFPIVYLAFYKNLKNKDLFQKALNYIVIGFISFFFIMSFKGPTQAQWTVPISFPLIIITFLYIIKNPKSKKIFKRLAIVNLVVIALARVLLANEGILPLELETHGNKTWVEKLMKQTKGQKKLFLNSYQNASLYSFYSKEELTGAYNSFNSRKNQFNIWNLQDSLINQDIVQIQGHNNSDALYVFDKKKKGKLYGEILEKFQSLRNLTYTTNNEILLNENNKIAIDIYNPYTYNFSLDKINTLVILKDANNKTIETIVASYKNTNTIPSSETSSHILVFKIKGSIDLKQVDHFNIAIRNNTKMAYQKVN
tara:strand:+ start:7742 stop:9388 length:1647 start_codon:yes stop_codon:yes gene_type:complete